MKRRFLTALNPLVITRALAVIRELLSHEASFRFVQQ
jgi:hypothetical protein